MKSRKKLKVLIITDYFYPHWTGISKSVFNLTQSLKNKIDFTVLTVRFDKNLKKEEIKNGVRIIRENYLFSFSRAKYSVSLLLRLFSIINKYDIVFINSPFTNIFPATIIAKLFGKKVFVFHQGDLILPKGLMNHFTEKVFDISSYIALLLSDKVSTYTRDYAENSRVLKPFLSKFYPLLIPVPKMPMSHLGGVKKLARLEILKEQNKILFGFAGRFVEEKGFDILFDAIPEVVKKIPNAHFVFAGETDIPYEKTFQKLKTQMSKVKSNLTFLGLLNDSQLSTFYRTIDFIVIPSRSDCFPSVQVEAMISKTPSIVSNIPGARYLVKKTGFGVIFEKENPKDLANKLIISYKNRAALIDNYHKVQEILDYKKNVAEAKKYFEI